MEQTQLQLETVKDAARTMVNLTAEKSAEILNGFADAIVKNADAIIEANQKDLSRMDPTNPMYDRLMLTLERIEGIASDTRKVATLEAPCGEIIEKRTLPNNLQISKVRVPLGVVGVIYEARPNVTVDVAALCIRSGNAVVLKGGSDAADSNAIIVDIMHKVLENCGVNPNIIQLLPPKREAANILMNAVGYVDVLIPRGSKNLINSVRNNSKVPIIETGAGVVHTYFDIDADLEKGTKIICNAKTRRVSVCNALECLIINSQRLKDLPYIAKPLAEKKVEIIADQKSFDALKDKYDFKLTLATEDDFGVEFNALKLVIKTVDNLDEALEHIYKYSTKHSEAIITENIETAERFVNNVDAACCYINASTAFTDGAQFGLGAEIGISTQKLHARGPMALKELTSYKWIIKGDGQIRLK